MKRLFLMILSTILLGACGSIDERATLQANHILAGTQISDLRITATVEAARARTTVDYANTRAALEATRSRFLESTLSSRGTAVPYLEEQRDRIIGSSPTPTITNTPDMLAAGTAETAPPPTFAAAPQETATPTLPVITPFGLVVTAPPEETEQTDPTAPRLEGFTIASGVGADDCAVDSVTTFSPTTIEIYIVATAVNLPAGSVIESRWFRSGDPIGPTYSFVPDFDIERACIWFYVDATDFEFLPGQYSADLLLNGQPASPLLSFSIAE